jgi:hypothetical protein
LLLLLLLPSFLWLLLLFAIAAVGSRESCSPLLLLLSGMFA